MPRLSNFNKSTGGRVINDEQYTPKILVKPILKYAKKFERIWCPFDTESSEFVRALKKNGHKVIHSHIAEGKDFFKYTPSTKFDAVVSNPPFSRKLDVLERLYELDVPFALVLGLPILNYQEVGEFFYNKGSDLQLLIVDKKVSFNGNTSSFNNSYFCRKFLPKQLIFAHLKHNNSKKHFKPSRMVLPDGTDWRGNSIGKQK